MMMQRVLLQMNDISLLRQLLMIAYQRNGKEQLSVSDKIDRIVTNRWLALPILH